MALYIKDVYQQLDQWLHNQRAFASEQLSKSQDSEYFTQNESSSSESDTNTTIHCDTYVADTGFADTDAGADVDDGNEHIYVVWRSRKLIK